MSGIDFISTRFGGRFAAAACYAMPSLKKGLLINQFSFTIRRQAHDNLTFGHS
jgi:hypothetical protein